MRHYWTDYTLFRTPDDRWASEMYWGGERGWKPVAPSETDLNHMREVPADQLADRIIQADDMGRTGVLTGPA